MLPTYTIGQQLTVDRGAYAEGRSPQLGDAVVFRAPVGAETGACGVRPLRRQPCPRPTRSSRTIRLLLRVVAGPGQRIAFRAGLAVVNGEPESGRELRIDDPACDICELPREATVPAGHWSWSPTTVRPRPTAGSGVRCPHGRFLAKLSESEGDRWLIYSNGCSASWMSGWRS